MSDLDKTARINESNAMVYLKTLDGQESVVEHGPNTVTYVPDGTVVAVLIIDEDDQGDDEDTDEQGEEKLTARTAKLMAKVAAKEFVKIDDYKKDKSNG
jgi:hypothetical protein